MHQIAGGRLGTAPSEFERMLDWLAREREHVWVAPVAEVAAHLKTVQRP
jgi:hypothetical protein